MTFAGFVGKANKVCLFFVVTLLVAGWHTSTLSFGLFINLLAFSPAKWEEFHGRKQPTRSILSSGKVCLFLGVTLLVAGWHTSTCSFGLCINLLAIGSANWEEFHGRKQPTRSVLSYGSFNMSHWFTRLIIVGFSPNTSRWDSRIFGRRTLLQCVQYKWTYSLISCRPELQMEMLIVVWS